MIVVPYDFSKADLSVSGDILTCLSPTTRLTLSTNLALDSIKWQFSNGNGPYFICCDDQLVTSEQDQTGTYQATARTSSSRCFSTGSKFIAEDKIRPRNDLDNELKWFCNTKEVDIKPNNVESGANISYNWSSNTLGNIISPITAKDVVVGSIGNYVLAVTNTKNGCSRSDTIKVVNETNVPRNIVLETEDISCYGKKDGQIDIKLSEGGFAPYQYFVNNTLVDASNILSNLAPGNYQVVVKDNYECEYAQSVTIIEPIELTIDAPSQLDVEYDEAVLLDFISSYNISELSQIEWTRDNEVLGTSETLSLNANADQDITISIKNENGCEAKARIRIMVNSDLELFLPNAFSPNGDGNNDRFVPFKNKIPVLSSIMKVYDRYGNMVFDGEIEFNNPESGWDGRYNGKNVEKGVYVYRINTIDIKGNKIDSSGTILVAR
jgi:gliding motility-associated-like protein